jgi:pyrophosphatase PpaX
MSSIRTILFDLDGTLINTNHLIQASFQHTFKTFGYEFTDEEIQRFNGPPLIETFSSINPKRAEEMLETYQTHNHAVHDAYVTAFPRVSDTVRTLKQHGIKMGVVTTKMRKGAKMGLELTGLTSIFDTMITFNDVEHTKPHPEPVLKAMNNLGANAASTLMVGDNYHDIEAGKNAGVQTAGVAWSAKGKDFLLQYKPTYMIDDMSELLQIAGVSLNNA